jgi:hypothetical protein
MTRLCISLWTKRMYWEYTDLGFSLLEAPCENILHGPLLPIYWLRLCSHSGGRPLEATLVRRMLFIVLMTAAHVSPNVFSLRVANVLRISYYNTSIAHIHIIHHIHMYIHDLYYTSHSYVHLHLHIFISSALCGRLAALNSLCPIQFILRISGLKNS